MRDHPVIEWCERTGYPRRLQSQPTYCECCGCEVDETKNVYEDDHHDYLCKFCLLLIHRKGW